MKLILKHSPTNWIDIDEEVKFKIDYLTDAQEDKLDELIFEMNYIMTLPEDYNNLEKEEKTKELIKIINDLTPEQKARFDVINKKYYRYYLKFTIKDWKGIKDGDGNEVNCKVINDELDTRLWQGLIKNLSLNDMITIAQKIQKELEFTEVDKKK